MRYDSARLSDFSFDGKVRRGSFDAPFFTLTLLLLAIGVLMVLSSSYARAYYDPGGVTGGNAAYYFIRQLVFALLGIGAMLVLSRVPMDVYRKYAFHFLALYICRRLLYPSGVYRSGTVV